MARLTDATIRLLVDYSSSIVFSTLQLLNYAMNKVFINYAYIQS